MIVCMCKCLTELPRERSEEEMHLKDEPANVAECRDSFIIWLANFTMTSRRQDQDLIKYALMSQFVNWLP